MTAKGIPTDGEPPPGTQAFDANAALMKAWARQGWRLQSLGYSVGQWTENLVHVDPCDCNMDEEVPGDRCMANSVWTWAILRDGGAFAPIFVLALTEARTGRKPGVPV